MWLATVKTKVQQDPEVPLECLLRVQRDRLGERVQRVGLPEQERRGTPESQDGQESQDAREPLESRVPPVSWD